MKNEICLARLKEIEAEYNKAYNELKADRCRKRVAALNAWANENRRFNVGDIIQSYNTIICIDKITGECSYEKLCCVYHGLTLTKQLKPRKDGWNTQVYDDGREIKLLKQKRRPIKDSFFIREIRCSPAEIIPALVERGAAGGTT